MFSRIACHQEADTWGDRASPEAPSRWGCQGTCLFPLTMLALCPAVSPFGLTSSVYLPGPWPWPGKHAKVGWWRDGGGQEGGSKGEGSSLLCLQARHCPCLSEPLSVSPKSLAHLGALWMPDSGGSLMRLVQGYHGRHMEEVPPEKGGLYRQV